MKKMFLILAACTAVGSSAFAAIDNEVFAGCTSNVNGDSGHTSKLGSRQIFPSNNCTCKDVAGTNCRVLTTASSCPWGYSNQGNTATGYKCCVDWSHVGCPDPREDAATGEPISAEVVSSQEMSDQSAQLEEVYGPVHDRPILSYFGYVDSVSKSPETGRGNSVHAKLDACLNHTNWDPSGSYPTCLSACGDGSKNGHCADNSGAVCIDRCECAYSQAGCNGL